MLSNLVCNHTCEKQIWLQLCCRQILLSLVWLETELYWTPVSPITITNAVIRFWSHPFWNDWCSLHSDVRQTLSLSYAWRFDLIAACSCCLSGSSVHLICEEDWLVSYFSLCWSSLDKIMFVVFILLSNFPLSVNFIGKLALLQLSCSDCALRSIVILWCSFSTRLSTLVMDHLKHWLSTFLILMNFGSSM